MDSNPFNDMEEKRPTTNTTPTSGTSPKPESPEASSERPRSRRWHVSLIVLVVVFGLGFVPMWLKAGRHASARDSALREVRLLQLEALAAGAAVDARRGEYEPDRQATCQIFTALRAELDLGPRSSLNPAQQNALRPLLMQRDNLVTLAARADPALAEGLTEVYLTCRKSLRGG